MKKLVIVMGPRRSGTSYAASVLHHLGFHLGGDLLPADDANPKGYFECTKLHRELQSLDMMLFNKHRDYEAVRAEVMGPAFGRMWESEHDLVAIKEPALSVHLRGEDTLGPVGVQYPHLYFILTRRPAYDAAMSHVKQGDGGHGLHVREARKYAEAIKWAEEFNHIYLDYGRNHSQRIADFAGVVNTQAAIEAFDEGLVDTWKRS